MGPDERIPRYLDAHVARPSEARYIHLGHWDDADAAADRGAFDEATLARAQKRLDDRLLGWAELKDGLRVADVGCGFGATLQAVDGRFQALTLLGVNIDRRQLAVARARPARNRLAWVVADACALPFARASVDRLLAIECAFHFAGRKRFLDEAARVLLPGGRLVLSDLVATPELEGARAARSLPEGLERALVFALSPCPELLAAADYARLAGDAGLVVERQEDATRATLPSFRCIRGDKPLDFVSLKSADDRGVAALAWLLERGLVRMEHWAFGARR